MEYSLEDKYASFIDVRVKNPHTILAELDATKIDLMHMMFGVAGEVGELMDAVKKHLIYGGPLNLENVEEELGDIEFYLEGLRQALSLDRREILVKNMEKLNKRYPTGYSDAEARDRVDKNSPSSKE